MSVDEQIEKTEEVAAEKTAVSTKPKVDTMESLIAELGDKILPFSEGDNIEAKILAVSGNRIWVDVAGQSLGFVPEREITTRAGLKVGDMILATVIAMEDEEGNVVLSLKRADRDKFWAEMEAKFKSGEPVSIKITDANKGGLMTETGGIMGFLPVSQLAPIHYPRVHGGDKDEILNRLRQIIGEELSVKVINCDLENNKLIFSEKAVRATEVKTKIDKFAVGDKIKGRITGIVDFGLFVSIDPEIEALVHISEISWTRVNNLHNLFKVGDEVETMVISVDDGRVSLSIKKLLPDPWSQATAKYKVGQSINGEVTKITPFGAFVSLDKDIDGLVHISELSSDKVTDPNLFVEVGKKYDFTIINIETDSHRLGLTLKKSAKAAAKEDSVSADVEPSESTDKVAEKKVSKATKTKKVEDMIEAVVEEKPVKEKKVKAEKKTK
ncbi:MAG: S1 RNA-binding domain-containing protein [Candidatus Berkelbacteria bacterium]